jgi:hypothetical protein
MDISFKINFNIKINVKGNGQECPFHTGVAALRGQPGAAVSTWGRGAAGETRVPRFARNDSQ